MIKNLDELFDKINKNLKNNKLENLSSLLEDYKSDDWKGFMEFSDILVPTPDCSRLSKRIVPV